MISLTQVIALANALLDAQKKVATAEEELKRAKELERTLAEESLPEAMRELELTTFKLSTGQVITIKEDVYASIPKDRRSEAFDWLETNGFGGLIKTEVVTAFGKGELDKATELANQLRENGMAADVTRDVHPQTLKAFLREQLAAAKNVPLETFGARPVSVAKLK